MSTTYSGCARTLERAQVRIGAAECHGLLCGLLCGIAEQAPERWLDEVLGEQMPLAATRNECREELLAVVGQTVRTLCSGQFDFTPLLPDDSVSLDLRSEALADWCSGFLYGIGSAGREVSDRLSSEAQEVLSDLADVTRLAIDAVEGDAQEADYAEIVEYLRVGVMLIFEELRAGPGRPDGGRHLH